MVVNVHKVPECCLYRFSRQRYTTTELFEPDKIRSIRTIAVGKEEGAGNSAIVDCVPGYRMASIDVNNTV